MSLNDITCKPIATGCCNEPSVISASGDYFVTVVDNARACSDRFTFRVDGNITFNNCACSCYRANIVYGAEPIRAFFDFVTIGYPVNIIFEPRITVNESGSCANFTRSNFVIIPSPCEFGNIRNIAFSPLCSNGNLNFDLINLTNGCGDSINLLGNFGFDFYLTITYLPPISHLHYELIYQYRLQIWQVVDSNYILFIFVGYILFGSACYIHYQEYDPFDTKEDYEVLNALFVGNDLREQDHDLHIIKQLLISRVI
jgi:hypothetical protein